MTCQNARNPRFPRFPRFAVKNVPPMCHRGASKLLSKKPNENGVFTAAEGGEMVEKRAFFWQACGRADFHSGENWLERFPGDWNIEVNNERYPIQHREQNPASIQMKQTANRSGSSEGYATGMLAIRRQNPMRARLEAEKRYNPNSAGTPIRIRLATFKKREQIMKGRVRLAQRL